MFFKSFFSQPMQSWFSRIAPALVCISVQGAIPAYSADLKVLKSGLGDGIVTSSPAGINCGADCDESFPDTASVTLTATPMAGSVFASWDLDADADGSTTADCIGTSPTCTLSMSAARSVRPVFALSPPIPTLSGFTPGDIQTFLTDNPSVTSAGHFVAALPAEFKQNWLMMARSESLQTGTAELPRILLPSENAEFTFTVGMVQHGSYPGAHPNAIEYMQWDASQKNFRFHEIVLADIPPIGALPARPRGVSSDDEKCTMCHSTRNVLNPGTLPGTTGITPGAVKAKSKPNWDTYDSWGGLLAFNRDRIYQGSVEAAAFRRLLNPWIWRSEPESRRVIEQLRLQQPPTFPAQHAITRLRGGANDGHVRFAFDPLTPVVTEPAPSGPATANVTYSFDNAAGTPPGTSVIRGGDFVTLHHTSAPSSDEGRGVNYFDHLGGLDGTLNQERVADELIDHRFATGSFPNMVVDVRPVALAISRNCLSINAATNSIVSIPPLTVGMSFFDARNGMTINDLVADTRARAESLPRRKADIQSVALDRNGDLYSTSAVDGLIQDYGASTTEGTSTGVDRLRREVFRRPIDAGDPDSTVMGGVYVDRELYSVNIDRVAMYRYFLEPLGVSVDKWSMGVRGRSRTYTFADIFGTYTNTFIGELSASLLADPRTTSVTDPGDCGQLIAAVNSTLATLPPVDDVPTYTDIQRIFNKACIECHGGLDYPPYANYGTILNVSENENHVPPADRLDRSHSIVTSTYVTTDPATSFLFGRITNPSEACPFGLMPCGGPPLSQTDIETIRRWIQGGALNTRGDPHIGTVSGQNYDFQAAGEFVLLKGQGIEVQARQTAVSTAGPLGPNGHTGLTSCVSINTAAAVRIGGDRVTLQPGVREEANPEAMELRVNGKLVRLTKEGIFLPGGGRIVQTTAQNGMKIQASGGGSIVITPRFWNHHQVWYMNIDATNARATAGLAGAIAPGNWLPALPDGSQLGRRPASLQDRYNQLYEKFGAAWRVTPDTALFDYAPGVSTDDFTVEEWPLGESPRSCIAPDGREPQQPIALAKAEELCQQLLDDVARKNCIQDVAVTGEAGFAAVYLAGERIERHTPPEPPRLLSPEPFSLRVSAAPVFAWMPAEDEDRDPLTYQYCLWPVTERFHRARHCTDANEGGKEYRVTRKLEERDAYYWKVIAEDGQGGTTESEIRRFETR
jgi:hypothetical protein